MWLRRFVVLLVELSMSDFNVDRLATIKKQRIARPSEMPDVDDSLNASQTLPISI